MGLEALQSARSPDERYQAYDPYTQRNRVKPYVPVPGMRKKALVPEQLAIVESRLPKKASEQDLSLDKIEDRSMNIRNDDGLIDRSTTIRFY